MLIIWCSDKILIFQSGVRKSFSNFAKQTNALLKINAIIHSIELTQNELEHTHLWIINSCLYSWNSQASTTTNHNGRKD